MVTVFFPFPRPFSHSAPKAGLPTLQARQSPTCPSLRTVSRPACPAPCPVLPQGELHHAPSPGLTRPHPKQRARLPRHAPSCRRLNCISTKLLGFLSVCSVGWHIAGTLTIVIGLPIIAPTRQSAKWVFTEFIPPNPAPAPEGVGIGKPGWPVGFCLTVPGSTACPSPPTHRTFPLPSPLSLRMWWGHCCCMSPAGVPWYHGRSCTLWGDWGIEQGIAGFWCRPHSRQPIQNGQQSLCQVTACARRAFVFCLQTITSTSSA
jgi:hypothetical protein